MNHKKDFIKKQTNNAKIFTSQGKTAVSDRLRKETESRDLNSLAAHLDKDLVLKDLWNNKKDSTYDKK